MKRLQVSLFTVLFFIIFAFGSCKEKNQEVQFNDGIIPVSTYYKPSKIIDSLTNIFLDSAKCPNCLNELYIDKVYDDEAYLTFIARLYDKMYLTKSNPLFYFVVNKKNVFVYSGIENFITGNQKKIESFKFFTDTANVRYLRMQFHLTTDSISLQPIPSEPFFPLITPAPADDKSIPLFDPKKDYSH